MLQLAYEVDTLVTASIMREGEGDAGQNKLSWRKDPLNGSSRAPSRLSIPRSTPYGPIRNLTDEGQFFWSLHNEHTATVSTANMASDTPVRDLTREPTPASK
jgi:hypothetical protein